MRKFLYIFAALAVLVAAFSCSCNKDKSFGIEYSLTSNGITDGEVTVVIPTGELTVNGDASYKFIVSNVDVEVNRDVKSLDEALNLRDEKIQGAAKRVNDWLNSSIYISNASGNYDIYIKGYVKETLTGLTFSVDKHFTSKEVK